MSQKNRRRRLFVEPRMQGLLVFKILLYWVNGFLTIGLLVAAWSVFTDTPRTSGELFANMWGSVGPALLASLFLLPLIMMDSIRWSNRYAGPMLRLHDCLRDLADGKKVQPLTFRKGDLWFEMAEHYNRILARVEQQNAPASEWTRDNADDEEPAKEPVAV